MTEQPMQVRVFEDEGGYVDSFDQQFYDSLAPAILNQQKDRCDGCGAEAHHAFVMSAGDGNVAVLLACSHHARTWHNAGMDYLHHRDYRTPMDEWQVQVKAAQDAALKAIDSKKLDESNFVAGTSYPKHLAQWDKGYYKERS